VEALSCPQNKPGQCVELCEQSAKASACSQEFASYSACARDAEWVCTEGYATVEACLKEQQLLAKCLQEKGSGSGTPGEDGNFFCDKTTCDGSTSQRACCLKIDFTTGVTSQCVASIEQCGQDSRWECDGPDDCGGKACCWSNPSTGSGQIILGLCKDSCDPFLGERQVCQDTCLGGLYCCKKPGEDIGSCEQSKEVCDSKPEEEENP
jgi:hypothetical protein